MRIILCLFCLFCLLGCEKQEKQTAAMPVFAKVVVPEKGNFQVSHRLIGQVKPYRRAQLIARVSGVLEKRFFREGSLVAKDAPLYQIERNTWVLAQRRSEADLAQARANEINAKLEFDRSEKLFKENAAAAKRFDSARAACLSAQAQVEAAQAALEQARLNVSYTTINAPFAGWIGFTSVDEGTYLTAPSQPLTTISQIDPVRIQFEVSDRFLSGRLLTALMQGNAAGWKVVLEMPDGTLFDSPVELEFWANSLDSSSATLALQAVAQNPRKKLLPGMYCTVILTDPQMDRVLWLDERAVRHEQGGAFVYVLDDQNTVSFRRLTVGESRGGKVVVESGLETDARVVPPGNIRIRPGVKIEVVP